jgi:hypothetical protein
MAKSNKIVDLQKCEDGTYSPKNTLNISKISKLKGIKSVVKKENISYTDKRKHMIPSGADEFLVGLDAGLDFVEAIKSRALRIMGLRD